MRGLVSDSMAAWIRRNGNWMVMGVLLLGLQVGCGTIREKRATDQLLLSDAVDRAIASIDFSALAHEKVFMDPRCRS